MKPTRAIYQLLKTSVPGRPITLALVGLSDNLEVMK